uniref:uncharacterized protein LOC120345055 isoform X3 n=1 Tax=Styela clava TaxID=7725 RepID=UPI00193AD026|nr:uncharacterized protein LOC120345055 isoform X3 [Styela clava]
MSKPKHSRYNRYSTDVSDLPSDTSSMIVNISSKEQLSGDSGIPSNSPSIEDDVLYREVHTRMFPFAHILEQLVNKNPDQPKTKSLLDILKNNAKTSLETLKKCEEVLNNCLGQHLQLRPPKIEGVTIEKVHENGEQRICVSWKKIPFVGMTYCVQVLCMKKVIDTPYFVVNNNNPHFFIPSPHPAKRYSVDLWAQNEDGYCGEKVRSDEIMICHELGPVLINEHKQLRPGYDVYEGFLEGGSPNKEKVAVKIISVPDTKKLHREIDNMQKLISHPNTVLYRNSGQIRGLGNRSYIVMELCEIGTLYELSGKQGLVYYFALSGGKHAFGSEEHRWKSRIIDGSRPDLSGLTCPDEEELAKDLILKMLQSKPKHRPSAYQVLQHPYFWDACKRLRFLHAVNDYLCPYILPKSKKQPQGITKEVMMKVSRNNASISTSTGENNWFKKMEEKHGFKERYKLLLWKADGKVLPRVKYNHNCPIHLLRYIRNICSHYREEDSLLKKIKNDEDLWNIFYSVFPLLFCMYYNIIHNYWHKLCKSTDFPMNAFESFYEIAPNKPMPVEGSRKRKHDVSSSANFFEDDPISS